MCIQFFETVVLKISRQVRDCETPGFGPVLNLAEKTKHMKYNKAEFIASVNKAMVDLKSNKPTEGRVCAVASVRCVRDWLIATLRSKEGRTLFGKETPEIEAWVKTEILELVNELRLGASEGFASNASAAAKAAGHKADSAATIDELVE